jgi:transcription initiation factor IIE alpha subunit
MEFVSQYKKNHEQKREHTSYVPCLTHCDPVNFKQACSKGSNCESGGWGQQVTPDPVRRKLNIL